MFNLLMFVLAIAIGFFVVYRIMNAIENKKTSNEELKKYDDPSYDPLQDLFKDIVVDTVDENSTQTNNSNLYE